MGGLLVNSFSFQKKIKVQDKIDSEISFRINFTKKIFGFIIDSLRSWL